MKHDTLPQRNKTEEQTGSTKINKKESYTGLCLVFNFKLGCFDDVHAWMYVHIYS